MKLFLASEAKHPETLEKLEVFVGGIQGKKIAYIPTAANGEFYGSWKGGGSIQTVLSLGADVNVIQLEDNHYTDVKKQIKKADIVWMAGGMSGYLLYWIRRIELDKVLPEMLAHGMIYVGSSAGSMICAETQYSSEWYLGEPEPGAGLVPGLGLTDFEIYPHYTEDQHAEIEKRWQQGKLYLLRDGEVITVEDDEVRVWGEERVVEK